MPPSILPSFLFFCYISSITPGPANLCSLSAALQRGRRAALQQWAGIFCGFFVVAQAAVLVAYFVGSAAGDYVGLLSFVGAAYLAYLALHTLRQEYARRDAASDGTAPRGDGGASGGFARAFLTGLFVQLTNVKIMIYCLTALTAYVLPYKRTLGALFAVGLFLPLTGPVANLVWLFAGLSLQRLFATHRRAVSVVMALSLLACAVSLAVSGAKDVLS